MNNVYNEEESKRARIFQREKRQELQLIIERCNQIKFEYVKVPSERNDNVVVFGSSKPRRIHFFAEDKSVNSYMRRCFKEQFTEPTIMTAATTEIEQKPSAAFASKVQRFQENLAIDSLQAFRRKKKVQDAPHICKISKSAFGSHSPRNLMCTRDICVNDVPTCSYVPLNSNKKYESVHYSFGGKILIEKAYDVVCSPKNLDFKCLECESEAKNVYWKSSRNGSVLCRKCYNSKLFNIKNKSRGVVEKFKNLQIFERDYKKKRHCNYYHQHNGTKAAITKLTHKEFLKQHQKENFLNTFMKY